MQRYMKNLIFAFSLSLFLAACNSSSSEEEEIKPILPIETPVPIEGGIALCLGLQERFSVDESPVDDLYVILYQDGQEPFRLDYNPETDSSRWIVYLDGEYSNAFVDMYFNSTFQSSVQLQVDNSPAKRNSYYIFIDHYQYRVATGLIREAINIENDCIDTFHNTSLENN